MKVLWRKMGEITKQASTTTRRVSKGSVLCDKRSLATCSSACAEAAHICPYLWSDTHKWYFNHPLFPSHLWVGPTVQFVAPHTHTHIHTYTHTQ